MITLLLFFFYNVKTTIPVQGFEILTNQKHDTAQTVHPLKIVTALLKSIPSINLEFHSQETQETPFYHGCHIIDKCQLCQKSMAKP